MIAVGFVAYLEGVVSSGFFTLASRLNLAAAESTAGFARFPAGSSPYNNDTDKA